MIKDLPNLFIIGEAGSGKDFIVSLMKEIYPNYESIRIAAPLYELAIALKFDNKNDFISILKDMGFDNDVGELIWGDVPNHIVEEMKDPSTVKPRKTLQVLGDIIRHYNIDALINYSLVRTSSSPSIIEDVRLEREAKYLSNKGFIGIRISTDKETREDRLKNRDGSLDEKRLNHITETEIDEISYDYVIDNSNATKEDLVDKIMELINGIE